MENQNQTEQTNSAQEAAQNVKVFRFTYEKTHTDTASVYVPAKSKEEAEAFIQELTDSGVDNIEEKLEIEVMQKRREDYDCGDEWELSSVELDAEKVDDQNVTVDWDYEDVLERLHPEE